MAVPFPAEPREPIAMQGLRISPGLLPPECEALRAEVRAFLAERDGRRAGGQTRAQLGGLEPRVHAQDGRARLDRHDLAQTLRRR